MEDAGTHESDRALPARRSGGRILRVLRVVALAVLAIVVLAAALQVIDYLRAELAARAALAELDKRGLLAALPAVRAPKGEGQAPASPEEVARDGTPYYEAAFDFALNDKGDMGGLLYGSGLPAEFGGRLTPETAAVLEQYVRERELLYAMVEAGRAHPDCHYRFDWMDVAYFDWDEGSGMRAVAHMLRAKSRLEQSHGNADAALDACAATLDVTGSFDECSLLMVWMMRDGAEMTVFFAAEEALSRTTPTAPSLGQLRDRFLHEADALDLRKVMLCELATGVEALRNPGLYRARTEYMYRKMMGEIEAPPGVQPRSAPWWVALFSSEPWDKSVATYKRLSAEGIVSAIGWYDWAGKPTPELAARLRSILEKTPAAGRDAVGEARSFQRLLQNEAAMRVAAVALSVEMYRLEHGRWPQTLQDLEGAAVTDPFTGAPMRYTKTDEGRLVYSVGANGRDDGGMSSLVSGPEDTDNLAFRLLDPDRRNRP